MFHIDITLDSIYNLTTHSYFHFVCHNEDNLETTSFRRHFFISETTLYHGRATQTRQNFQGNQTRRKDQGQKGDIQTQSERTDSHSVKELSDRPRIVDAGLPGCSARKIRFPQLFCGHQSAAGRFTGAFMSRGCTSNSSI